MNKKAFTLIELIVVITILSILGTIAFISFKGYSTQARDSKRITEISSLNNSLGIYLAKKGTLPEPESSIRVAYGSEEMTIQGEMGENVLSQISASQNFKDPSSLDYYFYSINSSKNGYDVFALLEGDSSYVTSAKASGDKNIFVKGTDVGYVFNSDGTELTGDLDIKGNSGTFQLLTRDGIIFDAKELDLLYLKSNFNDFLVGHWDMSTKNQDGTLKDLSGKGNKGTITGNPVISNGKMVFDGIDDRVEIVNSSSINLDNKLTFAIKIKQKHLSEGEISIPFTKYSGIEKGGWHLGIQDLNKIRAACRNKTGHYYTTSSYTFDSGEDLYLYGTYFDDGVISVYKFYVNGQLISKKQLPTGNISTSSSVNIGYHAGSHHKTEVYEAKIFNTVLPEKAIRKLSK